MRLAKRFLRYALPGVMFASVMALNLYWYDTLNRFNLDLGYGQAWVLIVA